MGKLDGRIAIITGAAMGNGEGIARVMAKHGAHVVLWDISERVYETAKSIQSGGREATPYKVDVRSFEQCKEAADDAIAKFGKVDVLCNNAGVTRMVPFLEMSDEVRDFQFDVNIKGVWNCTKAVLPNMKQNQYGRIIIMSSVTGPMVANTGETAYATTKAALWGFTKALAIEVVKDNITVNAICPGMIRTPMVENEARKFSPDDPDSVLDMIASTIPMGRLGNPLEIGELAAFLASDESSYITGAHVVIDGGNSLPEIPMP
ncbi:MAG: SDR family oxidoreductase UcpA [Candidatus Abyssobacteria bacterium SURF_17]|uniref:SDR family oxidoreductase UcpA n=1 Tax=Candidatus Abyssobacteria bacterium SURF_17 TaxID=2093361 RepID=A0A419ER14_9BACT|nr:MAG: SDR family oxidoreductase UcpA [Candidatus Abyssubacteria bacterium SURF_17]